MKRLLMLAAVAAVLVLPSVSSAGVAGSDHDLTGTGDSLCFACHVPHNAQGAKLWATAPSGTFSGVQDLCYTCHDGSVTNVGVTTAFNTAKEQHAAVGADCSGNGACHDVHNQNPNGSGKFLVVTDANANNTYCDDCHGATPFPGAEALGDHTAGITHFTDASFTCDQCHSAHGATPQTTNPTGLTNPILLADNQPGAYYGAFCISCHNGTAPAEAVSGTGGVAASDVFDYSEAVNDGTEAKHPTITTGGAFPVGGCNKCHDVHDPAGTNYGYLLMADNANSAYCRSCHDGAQAPGVGGNTHPDNVAVSDPNMNSGLTPALPWANQIDEDGNAGADWPSASANFIVCESCHSVHRQGYTGADQGYLLRDALGQGTKLCTDCHSAN